MTDPNIELIKKLHGIRQETEELVTELSDFISGAGYASHVQRARLDDITSRVSSIVGGLTGSVDRFPDEIPSDVSIAYTLIADHCMTIIDSLRYLYRRDTKLDDYNMKKTLDQLYQKLFEFRINLRNKTS